MNDNVKQSLANLLKCLGGGDPNREVSIFFEGATWDFKAYDLKDIFLTALFEVPALREELDAASKDVETLQKQIAAGTPSLERSKWEYRFLGPIYNTINEQLETQLNEMGRDGWELVNVEWELVNVEFEHGRAIFKRQK